MPSNDQLATWIKLRTKPKNLSVRAAAEYMGCSERTGSRFEARWRERQQSGNGDLFPLIAEFVTEPQPDGRRGYWCAYPNREPSERLVHAQDRAALAWGRGSTQRSAIEDARRRGHRILDDDGQRPEPFPAITFTARGVAGPWDFGGA